MGSVSSQRSWGRRSVALLCIAAAGCATLQSSDGSDASDGQGEVTDPVTADGGALDGGERGDGDPIASDGDPDGSLDGEDGDPQDGSANADGTHGDGTHEDGTPGDGSAADGSPEDGSASDGSAADGSASDGSAADGSAEEDGDVGDGVDDSWAMAGNSACGRVPPSGTTASIESVEDGNAQIARVDHRLGYWFSYRDETDTGGAVDTPAAVDGGANGTLKALKIAGRSASTAEYGPGFGFSLYSVGSGDDALNCPYDASAYGGVTFYVRGTGVSTVELVVLTEKTVEKVEGGTCTADCDDHFGKAVAVTSTWTKVTVRWSDLAQAGWGTATTFDPARIAGLAWSVAPGATFELRVDEVEFLAP